MNKILRFKYLLRKWQSFRGEQQQTQTQQKNPLVMAGARFAEVFFSGCAGQKQWNSRDVSVLCCRKSAIRIWCLYSAWFKSSTWTCVSCLSLECPKCEPIALFRSGLCSSFVWNAKGKGNRNSCTNTGAGPWAQLCWFAVWWENAGGFFLPSLPHGIFGPESKGEMLTQPLHASCLSWTWENCSFQIGQCVWLFPYCYFPVDT